MGPPDPGATRRGAHDRWLVALVVLAVVLLVAAVAVAWVELRGDDEPDPAGAPTTTSEPDASGSPSASAPGEPTSTPEADPTEAEPGGDPLPELAQRFGGSTPSVSSDVPESEDTLQDGAFFAVLHGVDAQARTISVDVAIFYGGQAAMDWLAANDPERAAEGPPENDYVVVNDVERVRELTVAPTARVGRWCYDDTGLITQEQTFEAWAAAEPAITPTTSCTEPGRQGNDLYWIDVRDGVVAQITGQYVP